MIGFREKLQNAGLKLVKNWIEKENHLFTLMENFKKNLCFWLVSPTDLCNIENVMPFVIDISVFTEKTVA